MTDDNPKLMVTRDFESPPGRWHVTVPATGVRIEGEFFRDLFQKVRQHHEANGLEPPDREDYEDLACRETAPGPSWCGKRPPKPVAGMLPFLTLAMAEKFILSVWEAIKSRRIVPREEAERRFAICMECPLSTSVGGCAGCYGVLKMVDKLWSKNPLPDVEEKRFCGACGCATRLKPWLFNADLDKAEKVKPLYWEKCWRYQGDRDTMS